LKIYDNPKLTERSKELRKNATFAERLLWKHLRGRQLFGYQFMRQKPIDNYIVDFYCSKLHLVIEIDGITHNGKQKYDEKKESKLEEIGLEVMRFDGYYVMNHINETLEMITNKIRELERITTPNSLF